MKKIVLTVLMGLMVMVVSACSSRVDIHSFEILNRRNDNEKVAYIHDNHWDGALPTVEEGESLSLGATIVTDGDHVRELDSDGEHNGFVVALADGAPEGIVSFGQYGDHVHIIGESPGTTQVVFSWTHDGDVQYTTPPINITVSDYHNHDDHHGEDEIGVFEILNRRDEDDIVAYIHDGHWHGTLPVVKNGQSLSLGAYIESSDDRERELDSDGEHNGFVVALADGAPEGIVSFGQHGDHVHIIGESPGITQVVFSWTHDGDIRYTTPPINVQVTE